LAKKTKITVVGSGYVGMSLAVLLSQHNDVVVLDIDSSRVDLINSKKSTIADKKIDLFLAQKQLSLRATLDKKDAYDGANFVIVATPTNFNTDTNYFDTDSVDGVVRDALNFNDNALIIIRSTIPLGHTKYLQEMYDTERIIFSPEFLREGQALQDNLHPSRIIIGSKLKLARKFATLLTQSADKSNIDILYMNPSEAEAVKLFANSYLAMRVSFFNELDSYAMINNLDTKSIIQGICLDKRIDKGYNNPSFGYGGYCLPKDTKQLLANFDQTPQTLIQAIVSSNKTRKSFIANTIIELKPKVIGIHRLIMKQGSDNYKESAIIEIINIIKSHDVEIVIYEPTYSNDDFFGSRVLKSLNDFKEMSDIIIANRLDKDLYDVEEKLFTRDIFGSD
tara:strand:+ start:681 stop:1859 length:1179 start_codon:yes stop_codon:yes gene_type:complete